MMTFAVGPTFITYTCDLYIVRKNKRIKRNIYDRE
jgi:hypothetical protein